MNQISIKNNELEYRVEIGYFVLDELQFCGIYYANTEKDEHAYCCLFRQKIRFQLSALYLYLKINNFCSMQKCAKIFLQYFSYNHIYQT